MVTQLGCVFGIVLGGFALVNARSVAADPGVGIVVDANERVYIADPGSNRIWRLQPDGRAEVLLEDRHSHLLQLGPDSVLRGEHLAYRPDQRWDSRFWEFDLKHNHFRWAGPALTDLNPFPDGQTLHLDGQGNAYSWLWAGPDRASQVLRRRLPEGQIEILGHDAWLPSKSVTPTAALMAQGRPFHQIVSIAFAPDGGMLVVQLDQADWLNAELNCQRRLNPDPPCRSNADPPTESVCRSSGIPFIDQSCFAFVFESVALSFHLDDVSMVKQAI
ncbi:hypothetical protein [Ahniella affigens]|uniref:hypothetical protein n=1 Tax=Ahniella affigens TaxID=2021234 RepID=UPI0011B235F3|nr:hypothetical protein [Ahniella affigens]